jgi:hypothetical protein
MAVNFSLILVVYFSLIVNHSQNLAFATSHFVIELLPFDYLGNQSSESNKKIICSMSRSTYPAVNLSTQFGVIALFSSNF